MTELLTYSKFYTNEDAERFTALLSKSGIEYQIEHERNGLDKIYIGETLDPMFTVKIPEDRFEDANKILQTEAESQLGNVNPEYYLFDFTDAELINVLKNPGEWNHFDRALAAKILSEKNIKIPDQIEKETVVESYPMRLDTPWIILEYLLSIVFGFIGIIIGIITMIAYRTLPDGKKVKMYDDFTIYHAKIMLVIGVIRTLLPVLLFN